MQSFSSKRSRNRALPLQISHLDRICNLMLCSNFELWILLFLRNWGRYGYEKLQKLFGIFPGYQNGSSFRKCPKCNIGIKLEKAIFLYSMMANILWDLNMITKNIYTSFHKIWRWIAIFLDLIPSTSRKRN